MAQSFLAHTIIEAFFGKCFTRKTSVRLPVGPMQRR
jgi:hypothetical protein